MINCAHTTLLAFRTATKSGNNQTGPNCVEVAPFFKATKSGPNCDNCVEVAFTHPSGSAAAGHCVEPGLATADHTHGDCTPQTCRTPGINPGDVVVRDSKLGEGSPLLVFSPDRWAMFTAAVAAGEREVSGTDYLMRDPAGSGTILRFTAGEWDAFQDGCAKAEFAFHQSTVSA